MSASERQATITIAAGAVGQELELTREAARRYQAVHPEVTIEVLDTPDLATDRLGLYLQFFEARSPEVDIYQIDVIWPGDLAEHLVDLRHYGAEKVVADHLPELITNNTVNGRLVGLPWFTDAGMLYYRSDLLREHGYGGPPETWDSLEEMARAIQEGERARGNPDFWGFVWQGNAYEGLTCNALEWIDSHGGGTIVSQSKHITINNRAAAEALRRATKWVGTISPPGVVGFAEEDARNMWQAGNAAFMRSWPYAYSLAEAPESPIRGKFDVAPLPAGDAGHGSAALGGWQLAASRYSRRPQVAADVILFLTSAEEQKIRAIRGSFLPTITRLYRDEEVLRASPMIVKMHDVIRNAVARPSAVTAPHYNGTSLLFFNAVHSVLTGQADAGTALGELELDLHSLLGYDSGAPEP